ncbi:TPA: glycosyltransferase domain-containing protein, partial [Enterococcus faecium]|nr:DUF616 domain-containing protein [Enterococcus faecium]
LEKRNLEIHELNQKNNSILGMKIRNKINQLNQMKKRDNLLPAKYTLKSMTGKGPIKDYSNRENRSDELRKKELTNQGTPKRIAVYSCITGNYDSIKEPDFSHPLVDYYLYTDNVITSEHWNIREIPKYISELKNNILINRYIKFHPNELFTDYDFTLYVDGNVTITSDITGLLNSSSKLGLSMHKHSERKSLYSEADALIAVGKGNKESIIEQISKYREEGFPDNFGLAEATVILVDLNNSIAENLLDLWWREYLNSESGRDQLAFPYVLWKSGHAMKEVTTLGNNVYKSAKLRIISHY